VETVYHYAMSSVQITGLAMTLHVLVRSYTYNMPLQAKYFTDPCGPTFCGGGPCCNPTANCRGVDHKAECSCPSGTEGEPRTGGTCRASSSRGSSTGLTGGNREGCSTCRSGGGSSSGSMCDPNPCGQGADCNVGSDRSGQARPVCTCP